MVPVHHRCAMEIRERLARRPAVMTRITAAEALRRERKRR